MSQNVATPAPQPPAPAPLPPEKPLEWYWSSLIGIYLVALVLLLAYMLYMVWPPSPQARDVRGRPRAAANQNVNQNANQNAAPGAGEGQTPRASAAEDSDEPAAAQELPPVYLFGGRVMLQHSVEVRLLLIVLLAGALGSYIHATTSFVDYVGNRKLSANWVWWYLLRPCVGMALALVFYFVVRGGFLSPQSSGQDMNVYGIAALAGLVGMFSKQATDKLTEVFTTLFRAGEGHGDEKRKDGLKDSATKAAGAAGATPPPPQPPAGAPAAPPTPPPAPTPTLPTIDSIDPDFGIPEGGDTVTIIGTNFAEGAEVTFGDLPAPRVTVVDSTAITALTPAQDEEGAVNVTVTNPDGTSATASAGFTYTAGA